MFTVILSRPEVKQKQFYVQPFIEKENWNNGIQILQTVSRYLLNIKIFGCSPAQNYFCCLLPSWSTVSQSAWIVSSALVPGSTACLRDENAIQILQFLALRIVQDDEVRDIAWKVLELYR